jgi:hypothetical protein
MNPSDPAWSEFHDPEVVDWKRVRAALEHENVLINQRFTWLLSCQGLLFAAYVLVFQSAVKDDVKPELVPVFQIVLAALALAGMLTGLFLSRGIHAAHQQHDVLKKWWVTHYTDSEHRHPPICGNEPKMWVTFHYHHLPIVFLFVWLIMALAALYEKIISYGPQIGEILLGATILIVAAGIGFLIGRRRDKLSP